MNTNTYESITKEFLREKLGKLENKDTSSISDCPAPVASLPTLGHPSTPNGSEGYGEKKKEENFSGEESLCQRISEIQKERIEREELEAIQNAAKRRRLTPDEFDRVWKHITANAKAHEY